MKRSIAAVLCGLSCMTAHAEAPAIWTEPLTGMAFIPLAKGCFKMGTAKPIPPKVDDFWRHINFTGSLSADEAPRHEVCIDAFAIGRDEVRWSDWHKVMGGEAPAGRENLPASNISWEQARSFAQKLTAQATGNMRFRLPTEAEWEYACRAGEAKDRPVPYTSEMVGLAWHNTAGLRLQEPKPVGELPPNKFGLNDMLGNVWEWVEDAYSPTAYAQHSLYNPVMLPSAKDGGQRVIRGGSYRSEPVNMRCAKRGQYAAAAGLPHIGLRLVRVEGDRP